ncbi:MAG: T9SS type A sorting domain-containing protein [Flavobacteriales bacterium]|nr:T9SS type A sorting domain-containing protein [Flavobacteriales bacterium]
MKTRNLLFGLSILAMLFASVANAKEKSKIALLHTYGSVAEETFVDAIEHKGKVVFLQQTFKNKKNSYIISHLQDDFFVENETKLELKEGMEPLFLQEDDLGRLFVLGSTENGIFRAEVEKDQLDIIEYDINGFTMKGFDINENNEIIVVGYSNAKMGQLLKLDEVGNILFSQVYQNLTNLVDVEIDENNEMIVLGNEINDGLSDVALMKLSPGGTILWANTFSFFGQDLAQVLELSGTDILIGGATNSLSPGNDLDMLAIKANFDGQLIWAKDYGHADHTTNGADVVSDIKVLPDNKILLSGYTMTHGGGLKDVYLNTIDQSGNWLSRSMTFGAAEDEETNKILLLKEKTIAIGSTNSVGHGSRDILLVELDTLFGGQNSIVVQEGLMASTESLTLGADPLNIMVDVYPNPTSDFVNLKIPKDLMGSRLKILDATGKLIHNQVVQQNIINFNMEALASSTYYVTLEVENEIVFFEKLIKR